MTKNKYSLVSDVEAEQVTEENRGRLVAEFKSRTPYGPAGWPDVVLINDESWVVYHHNGAISIMTNSSFTKMYQPRPNLENHRIRICVIDTNDSRAVGQAAIKLVDLRWLLLGEP